MAKLVGTANQTTVTTTTHFRIEGSGFTFFVSKHIDKHIDNDTPSETTRLITVKVDWYIGDVMLQMTHFPGDKREYRFRKDRKTGGEEHHVKQADLHELMGDKEKSMLLASFRELNEWCADNPHASELVASWAMNVLRDAGAYPSQLTA